MFGNKSLNRVITDYGIGMPDLWYPVDLDGPIAHEWARDLSVELATTPEGKLALAERLEAVYVSLASLERPGLTAALWIRDPESGLVDAILALEVGQLDVGMDSAQYLQGLADDEGTSEPGKTFQVVQTWTTPIDAGLAVGAYNLISHREPGDEAPRIEERTIIAVFPPRSSQIIECVFTTVVPGTYDDIILETMAHVASLRIEVGKP